MYNIPETLNYNDFNCKEQKFIFNVLNVPHTCCLNSLKYNVEMLSQSIQFKWIWHYTELHTKPNVSSFIVAENIVLSFPLRCLKNDNIKMINLWLHWLRTAV